MLPDLYMWGGKARAVSESRAVVKRRCEGWRQEGKGPWADVHCCGWRSPGGFARFGKGS